MPFQKGEKNPNFGKKHTNEWKQWMSNIQKGKTISEETRKKISINQTSRGHPFGYKMPLETRKKISKSRKGIKFSEEHLKHLSESHKGQIVTDEGKRKRSEYNKSHPEVTERLRKIRCARPSKPQKELFEIIKALYPDEKVELEYTLIISKKSRKFIDVAIPARKMGWEFDCPAWHSGIWGSKEKDIIRHNLIESLGWKLEHYSDVSEFTKIKKMGKC